MRFTWPESGVGSWTSAWRQSGRRPSNCRPFARIAADVAQGGRPLAHWRKCALRASVRACIGGRNDFLRNGGLAPVLHGPLHGRLGRTCARQRAARGEPRGRPRAGRNRSRADGSTRTDGTRTNRLGAAGGECRGCRRGSRDVPRPQQSPEAAALRARLAALPTEGSAEELKERVAVSDFYAARNDSPLWFADGGSERAGRRHHRRDRPRRRLGPRPRRLRSPAARARRDARAGRCCRRRGHAGAGGAQVRPLRARRPHHRPDHASELQPRPQAAAARPAGRHHRGRRRARGRRLPALAASPA